MVMAGVGELEARGGESAVKARAEVHAVGGL